MLNFPIKLRFLNDFGDLDGSRGTPEGRSWNTGWEALGYIMVIKHRRHKVNKKTFQNTIKIQKNKI
jgi:hypothetical protein